MDRIPRIAPRVQEPSRTWRDNSYIFKTVDGFDNRNENYPELRPGMTEEQEDEEDSQE